MKTLQKKSISALIIARNEEATIGKVINESIKTLPKITDKYEILVNDDASSDQTSKILDDYSRKYSFIKVFNQKKALGISGGFEFLYTKSKMDLIFINAADGQYTIYDLPAMVNELSKGFDLIIGKRISKEKDSKSRKVVSVLFNFLPKVLFGFNLYDAGSNKLYKKEVLKKTKPVSKSVFSEAERIIRAYKLDFKVSSVPIRYSERKKGTSSSVRVNLIYQSVVDMLRLYFHLK